MVERAQSISRQLGSKWNARNLPAFFQRVDYSNPILNKYGVSKVRAVALHQLS